MPVFFERYLLPLLAGIVVTVVIANAWTLTFFSRGVIALISIGGAFAIAQLVHQYNQRQPPSPAPSLSNEPVSSTPIAVVPSPSPPTGTSAIGKSQEPVSVAKFTPFVPSLPTSNAERVFVKIDPNHLHRLSKELTSLQLREITKQYTGHWARVRVPIHNVVQFSSGTLSIYYYAIKINNAVDFSVQMRFNSDWHNRLSILRIGEWVTVDGKIDELDSSEIVLENCELLQ